MKTYTINVIRAGNVTVSGSTGADGTYGTLKDAFDALNANGTQAGNVISCRSSAIRPRLRRPR